VTPDFRRRVIPLSNKKMPNLKRKVSGKPSLKKAELTVHSRNRLLSSFTEDALRSYFKNLNGHQPADMYKLVIGEVEPSLFRTVMDYADGNQTIAANILGINRATLRKKLKQYHLHS
jgi:Fis family transcriptional regulator